MSRYVTVASVSQIPIGSYEDLNGILSGAKTLAVRAARMGADILVYPEVYPQSGATNGTLSELAEPMPGKTVTFMADVAKANRMYIIWPLYLRREGLVYNSAILIGRDGSILGIYDKMFPTISEIESGCTPGTHPSVFQTDFGKIGIAICFDLNFRPCIEALARNGAEIIFFPSAYRGGLQLRIWAHEFGIYLVSAIGGELGQIVDLSGTVLAESTYEALITQRINLDRRLLHMDGNWHKMDEMLEKYGTGLTFQYFTREGKYTIASEMPDGCGTFSRKG